MKKLFLLAATAFALFSCSNGEDVIPEQRTKNVVVQFAPSSLTRAAEGAVASGAKAEIKDYAIFFLDAAGNVVKGTATGTAAPTDAVACTDVGETAVSVYVVANTGSSYANIDLTAITPENNSTLKTIKDKVALVSKQATIGTVVLANSAKADNGKIMIETKDGVTSYSAAVEIAPVVARLEIGKIKGTGGLTGFTLEGIYIDGHAVEFTVGGGYNKAATGDNITDGIYSIGVDNSLLGAYSTSFCDKGLSMAATKTGNDYIAAPTSSNVWAYQLAAGAPLPSIVVKLSSLSGGNIAKYITVNKYTDGSTTYNKPLAPGTVYKIDAISFETKNTAEVPNAEEKNVSVTVTVKAWEVVNLTPGV